MLDAIAGLPDVAEVVIVSTAKTELASIRVPEALAGARPPSLHRNSL